MALNFPDSPTLNQVYTDSTSGFSYQWNGTVWISKTDKYVGNIKEFDDISGSFNGTQTQFALTSGGISVNPESNVKLIISIGGVVQEPIQDYYISSSNIVFTTAPTSGLTFFGTLYDSPLDPGTIVDGSITPAKLSTGGPSWNTDGDVTITGVGTTALLVNGNARVTGILTVGSSSITLDGSNNVVNVGSGITITSGDIIISGILTSSAAQIGPNVSFNSSGINVSGVVTATSFVGIGSNLTGLNFPVTDNTATNAFYYPLLSLQSSGSISQLRIKTGSLAFNPSSGILSATSFVGSGSAITALNASSISSGTVPTARLASGTANSSTFLRGDQTWATVTSGITITNDTSTNSTFYPTFTSATSGSVSTENVASSKLTFNPSTGVLTSSEMSASSDLRSPNGASSARPGSPATGSIRWNSDYNTMEMYTGTEWRELVAGNTLIDPSSARGVFGGGYLLSSPFAFVNTIDYVTIASVGNATDFGDLTIARRRTGACSSTSRGLFGGGSSPGTTNTIDYITITSVGNATDFGDLTVSRTDLAACSSSTRGLFGGGTPAGSVNVIDYVTIASVGNAIDFGDLTQSRSELASFSSSTRGVWGGGYTPPSSVNTIDYVTIASTGVNATDFGDLSETRRPLSGCSSSTRGLFASGGNPSTLSRNLIDYVTIATTGNATDFGDLSVIRVNISACSNLTRGVFGGGNEIPGGSNVIDYVTIATTGNATDFGDLTQSRDRLTACSNNHGGLINT